MTQNERDLLFKDLSARLPYRVKIKITPNEIIENVESVVYIVDSEYSYISPNSTILNADNIKLLFNDYWKECKPYLFPMSSMTEEQKYDFYCRFIENDCDFDDFKEFYFENNEWHKMLTSIDDIEEIIDWFNKNHFDYRSLIPMGLAIDATDKNIY